MKSISVTASCLLSNCFEQMGHSAFPLRTEDKIITFPELFCVRYSIYNDVDMRFLNVRNVFPELCCVGGLQFCVWGCESPAQFTGPAGGHFSSHSSSTTHLWQVDMSVGTHWHNYQLENSLLTLGAHAHWGLQYLVCVSVTMFFATTRNKSAKNWHQWVQRHTGLIINLAIFVIALCSTVMVWKPSQQANMLISTGIPRPGPLALCISKAQEGVYQLPHAIYYCS